MSTPQQPDDGAGQNNAGAGQGGPDASQPGQQNRGPQFQSPQQPGSPEQSSDPQVPGGEQKSPTDPQATGWQPGDWKPASWQPPSWQPEAGGPQSQPSANQPGNNQPGGASFQAQGPQPGGPQQGGYAGGQPGNNQQGGYAAGGQGTWYTANNSFAGAPGGPQPGAGYAANNSLAGSQPGAGQPGSVPGSGQGAVGGQPQQGAPQPGSFGGQTSQGQTTQSGAGGPQQGSFAAQSQPGGQPGGPQPGPQAGGPQLGGQPQGSYGPGMPPQGPGPYGGQPQPGGTFGQPGVGYMPGAAFNGAPAAPKKRSWKLPIIIGSIVLALIIGCIITMILTGGSAEKKTKEAVKNYLTAISESDANKAKKYLSSSMSDTSLLTDEVLKDSNSRAPMSNISVSDPTQGNGSSMYEVPATYTIGGTTVTTNFKVSYYSDATIYSDDYLSLSAFDGIDITVNGVKPSTNMPYIFPGDYLITTVNQYLTVTNGDVEAYDPEEDSTTGSNRPELAVSDAGVQMFREKVIGEAQTCLSSTKIDPGCGAKLADLSSGGQVKEDSVHRTQDAENSAKLQSVTPEPGVTTPTVIKADYIDLGMMDITAQCGSEGNWSDCELWGYGAGSGFYFGSPSIDLNDPDLKVVWEKS